MKTMLKIAAAIMLATGGAAWGAEVAGADASGADAQSSPKGKKAAAKAMKYCARIAAATGTRIERRECFTKAEWEEMGVELKETR
jgi:hypothetical protein